MNQKPKSRKENIVIQELENEVLIYDLVINKAFSLNETCAMVWAECDGKKSIAEIASTLSQRTKGLVSEEAVWLALETLQKENLLANSDVISSKFNGMSRREVIRKVGFATMVAIPVITSLIAPAASNAASGASGVCAAVFEACVGGVLPEVQSNCCDGLFCAQSSSCRLCLSPNFEHNLSNPTAGSSLSSCQSNCLLFQGRCCSKSTRFTYNPSTTIENRCRCFCN